MKEFIRHKRKNQQIFRMRQKVAFPVTDATKNELVRQARLHCFSQAELGSVILMHYLQNKEALAAAITEYQQTKAELEVAFVHQFQADVQRAKFDRTFGGFFKSSFPDEEE